MRAPQGLLGADGKPGKANVLLASGMNGNPLQEYGYKVEGNQTTCYVLASPGDIITVPFSLNAGIGDFVDLVVDGVLRKSATVHQRGKKFGKTFKKVCYSELKWGRRAGLKSYKMEVRSRNTKKGRNFILPKETARLTSQDVVLTGENSPSAVGSIQVQIFRIETTEDVDEGSQNAASREPPDQRAPKFDKYPSWSELNCYINSDGPPPPFEIG